MSIPSNADGAACALIPGPSTMAPNVLAAYSSTLGSPDTDEAFWDDYLSLEQKLQGLLRTSNSVAIQSGEGMVALWGAMRSTIRPGDPVVCAVNGVFGAGFASMAEQLGAKVFTVESDWRHPVDVDRLVEEIRKRDPKLVTMVHCETPSGMLNSLEGVGDAIAQYTSDGLFLVDFVSSAGGAPLKVDEWKIDLGLLAPQKVLSGPAALGMTSISDKAWKRINAIGYNGYDALQPFYRVAESESRLMPYTHNWHAVRATLTACDNIQAAGGLEANLKRHADVAQYCRDLVREELKLPIFVADERYAAPTVTAVELPEGISWAALNKELKQQRVFLGGSYGPLTGKVFRIGHMGTQADKPLVARAVRAVAATLKRLR